MLVFASICYKNAQICNNVAFILIIMAHKYIERFEDRLLSEANYLGAPAIVLFVPVFKVKITC